jgi:hypothetical protein
MSGIGQMMAASDSGSPPTPFSATVFIQGGSSGVSASTPSGSTTAIPGGGERFFLVVPSGGTGPFTYQWIRTNGVNKTALESTNAQKAYVSWADMTTIGEYSSVTAICRVTDTATGESVDSNNHVIGITRV